MAATPEYYEDLLDGFDDPESLTLLVVRGASREQVAAALDVSLETPVEADHWTDHEGVTAWALLDVPGGTIAYESSGYGDPAVATLVTMSEGGAAAVARSNVQAHLRFGCARGGELLFDDDEYTYVEDPSAMPDELRPLFDQVWEDLDDEEDADDDGPDPFAVALAMAEVATGLEISSMQVSDLLESGFFRAPSLVYTAG